MLSAFFFSTFVPLCVSVFCFASLFFSQRLKFLQATESLIIRLGNQATTYQPRSKIREVMMSRQPIQNHKNIKMHM